MLLAYRSLRRRLRMLQRPVLVALLVLFLLDAIQILCSRGATVRVGEEEEGQGKGEKKGGPKKLPSVFIVSVHRNTERILHDAWVDSVVALVDRLGRDNVYVSAVESGSQDQTKQELDRLRQLLAARGVGHSIVLGTTVWEQLDELYAWPAPDSAPETRPGWIWDADEGHYALRRIPYLARVRNEAMAVMRAAKVHGGQQAQEGNRFQRILWINDVAFDVADALTLLDTRGGHYAAACAVDFMAYPRYYDTFALRDAAGQKAVSALWPWFRSAADRADVMAGRPVRVRSCWNGMVAFDAQPFYGGSDGGGDSSGSGLTFRGVDDSLAELHLEASECCLIHADNPLSGEADSDPASSPGVWLNPNVRVAYSVATYRAVRRRLFPGIPAAVIGVWANRWLRFASHVQFTLENQEVLKRLRRWRAETPAGETLRHEPGADCLINEMQIMWQNGWKHL